MLKLLVIDDEIVILQGILKILREGKTPFTQIESALDASEAFSVINYFQPDLIITDINMPGKNGLQFIEEVKNQNLCKRFIIFSGYDDFEYAKKAIRIQVIDYLLKPIDKKEMLLLLKKTAKEILEEKESLEKRYDGNHHPSYSFHIETVMNYIQNNYQEDLFLEKFAELTDLHPNYISSLFKKEVGLSVIQYLQDYRIEKAKELLIKHQTMPVHLIGNQVGYENSQHFLKVFKKMVGCTPGAYREGKENVIR